MLRAASSPPRLSTLVLLTALSVLSLNMFLPSLANIAEEFEADYALVNFSIAGYLGIMAVLQLIMGPLSDRYGRRPVLLAGTAIFALASLGCALADNIWIFLVFRILQGAIVAGNALSRAVIRDMVPAQEAASLMAYVAMAMAVAPMLGPMFGGVLDELFGWRASFVVFTGLGVLVLGLCWIDLGETNLTPSETFVKQFRDYPELLQSRRFWGYASCLTFSTGAFYAFLGGAPLVANTQFGLSPATLGICMGTITAGFMFGNFLSGRYAKRYPLTALMMTGSVLACAGLSMGLVLFLAGVEHVATLFGATAFVGIGNGLIVPSSNAGAMSVQPRLAGSAAGLSGALMVGGGALLSSGTGAVLSEVSGAHALLGMMLLSSLLGLLAALSALRMERSPATPRSA